MQAQETGGGRSRSHALRSGQRIETIDFRVRGLEAIQFQHLYGLADDDLVRHGARRYIVDKKPGFPDRVEMRDVEIGERVLLLNFVHQPAGNPYRASHAIFVREGATAPFDEVNTVPEVIRIRPISLRAFDDTDEMVDADLVSGDQLKALVKHFFLQPKIAYLHAHYAKRGCYAARIDKA